MNQITVVRLALIALSILPVVSTAGNAIQPDAGRTLQELAPPPALPKPSVDLNIEAPEVTKGETGGVAVSVEKISVTGNTIYDSETLLAVIGDTQGKSYDLAGLKNLANLVTDYYRKNGYPFARAIIPAQSMADGVVVIEVIEGRYNGSITVNGSDKLSSGGQKLKKMQPLR